jgi:hypothetical protein
VPPLVHIDAAAATVTVPRSERARLGKAARAAAVGSRAADAHAPLGGALNDYVCGGPPVQVEYLNISDVKKALHVPTDAFFFQCDNGAGFVRRCCHAHAHWPRHPRVERRRVRPPTCCTAAPRTHLCRRRTVSD